MRGSLWRWLAGFSHVVEQTDEIQTTADSEPKSRLEFSSGSAPSPRQPEQPSLSRSTWAHQQRLQLALTGRCILHSGHCNREGSLHARNARPFA
jgi:hypothetical protein